MVERWWTGGGGVAERRWRDGEEVVARVVERW